MNVPTQGGWTCGMQVLDDKSESQQGRRSLALSECRDSIIGAVISLGCLGYTGDCQLLPAGQVIGLRAPCIGTLIYKSHTEAVEANWLKGAEDKR